MGLIKMVKDLISLMNENSLTEIEIEEEGTKIRLKKNNLDSVQTSVQLPSIKTASLQEGSNKYLPSKQDKESAEIVAPMVGTFYSSAPGAEPYVKMGDTVDEETVVCIIEAMKIMNEVKAETEGKIVEVMVENGTAVEFGQPLFRIEASEGE
ncbi:MAG: acetyl-CoA carboxylase biotin carboxyl carrier protein [Planctomycetota bacterium]|jgi:acetyl-CoA carboxylase biotin carboxyl carrier protein